MPIVTGKLALTIAIGSFFLQGCGGGGTAANSRPNTVDETIVNTRNHVSGSKIFIGDEILQDQVRRYAAAVTDQATLEFIFTDDGDEPVNIISNSYFDQNDYGQVRVVSFSVGGENFKTTVYLDTQSDEEVTTSGTFIAGRPNVVAEGAKLTSVPSGVFVYQGGLIQSTNSNYFTSGTFTMTADFDRGIADLQGNTAIYNIFVSEMPIDSITGRFSSDSLRISSEYRIGNPSWNGQIDGVFTGNNASGVAGVYSTTDSEIVGGFSGVR